MGRKSGARRGSASRRGRSGLLLLPLTLAVAAGCAGNRQSTSTETETSLAATKPTDAAEQAGPAVREPTPVTPPEPQASEPPSPTTSTTAVPAPTYAFPVQPPSVADYPNSHHTYPAVDIFAPCGTSVVAPTAGTIQEVSLVDSWSSDTNDPAARGGLSFSIVGADGVRYYGSHLARIEPEVSPGAAVSTGQKLGEVGRTGNAAGTPCHLHFGISLPCGPGDVLRRRGEFWPQQYLDAWAESEQLSPTAEVAFGACEGDEP